MSYRPFGQPYMDPYMGGWWWLGALFQLVFLVIVVLGLIFLARMIVRGWQPSTPAGSQRSKALEELDLRYARGEIDRTEYFQRRTDLVGGSPPGQTAPPPATKP
jgi:putative membrane protein